MELSHLKLTVDDRTDEGVFRVHKDVLLMQKGAAG